MSLIRALIPFRRVPPLGPNHFHLQISSLWRVRISTYEVVGLGEVWGVDHKYLVHSITYFFSITYLKKVPLASALYFLHILHRHRKVKSLPTTIINGELQIRWRLAEPQNQLCNCTHALNPTCVMLWESSGDGNAAFQGWKEPRRCQGA